jgi:hypothetical protein
MLHAIQTASAKIKRLIGPPLNQQTNSGPVEFRRRPACRRFSVAAASLREGWLRDRNAGGDDVETEPGEVEVAEEDRREHPDTGAPVEREGEPEQRVDEEDPEELEDPERHGAGPSGNG